MESNGWDYAYAAGYVSGADDGARGRKRDLRWKDVDDYAKGYHKGYANYQPQPT